MRKGRIPATKHLIKSPNRNGCGRQLAFSGESLQLFVNVLSNRSCFSTRVLEDAQIDNRNVFLFLRSHLEP